MRVFALTAVSFCGYGSSFLYGQMNVAVCNASEATPATVVRAEKETRYIYRSAGIAINWVPCDDLESRTASIMGPLYIIRLRSSVIQQPIGASSLEMMGKAFLTDQGNGRIADAYITPIQVNAAFYALDPATLLGCVVAHELGHLLLGPGHSASGVMRTGWRGQETRAADKRWLAFNRNDSARLRQGLQRAITAESQSHEYHP